AVRPDFRTALTPDIRSGLTAFCFASITYVVVAIGRHTRRRPAKIGERGTMDGDTIDARLVDAEAGLIDRRIFSDQDIFEQEMRQVFGKSWLFVGHESQIPNKGDYFMSQAGRDAVVVTRDSDGEVRVMLNMCTHRGMPVCRYDKGNAKRFTCPYHGWTFSNNGELSGLPLSTE